MKIIRHQNSGNAHTVRTVMYLMLYCYARKGRRQCNREIDHLGRHRWVPAKAVEG